MKHKKINKIMLFILIAFSIMLASCSTTNNQQEDKKANILPTVDKTGDSDIIPTSKDKENLEIEVQQEENKTEVKSEEDTIIAEVNDEEIDEEIEIGELI